MKDRSSLVVGRVTGVHGLRGQLKAVRFTESTAFFEPGAILRVKGSRKSLKVVRLGRWKQGMILTIEGVTDRSQAEHFIGAELEVPRASLPKIEDSDTYYWEDLIGLTVFEEAGDCLGTLAEIIATGSNDVFVVRRDEEELLVPALASVVSMVDLAAGFMRVLLPEGLPAFSRVEGKTGLHR